ncbi:MAG TPA: M28 family peptidase [Bacteroidales bacterium]|nr:M28 family peptidase [Bacteroidales bacterium]
MKRFLLLFAVIGLILSIPAVHSQDSKVIKKIIGNGTADNQTMNHLDILSNRFGGRLAGSDAYENAAEWCASKFREWGMQVELDETGEVPVGFNRGPWFGRMLGNGGMVLHFATPSYTSGTKGIQRGHVVLEPKNQTEFDRMKGKLKGAWVLICGTNTGWPIDYSEAGDSTRTRIITENNEIEEKNREIQMQNRMNREAGEQQELLPYKEEPALFYRQMADAGILGIIQSAPVPIRALYDRKNINNKTLTFDNLPTIPDIKLDEHQYRIIEQMAKERQYFELEFDIRNHFRMGPVKYHNVIGIIPGTKYPDEYVIMGGHLDAFDVATGGVDDGSGLTPAMEAARLIMKAEAKPKRTILVCLWAAEEFGLLGSKSWVERNHDKLDKISNMFNRDGGPTVANSLTATEAMYDDMAKICEPLNDINPDFPFKLNKREGPPRPPRSGGTDSGSFAVVGVPTMTFGTADTKGYDFNYGEIWHTERDLYNMSIPEYQEHTAVLTAIVVLGVANLDHLLSREDYYLIEE